MPANSSMSSSQPSSLSKTVDLQTLVAAIQNAVQAQNLIATNIKALTAAFASFVAVYPTPFFGSVAWTPGGIANGASTSTTIAISGVTLGNFVQVSFNNDIQGLTLTGYVSAADTVTVVLSNATGGTITIGAGTVNARVNTV